ncbi:hypothetical protein [Raineyella sp. LH-20]|uniref:hypothetical protein n=1 Tax=Raineyella sp. LH-20 TaxID=3081204 RepID=UPI002955D8BE|nr:hypothetical protein [Raineyella sp. LH-20]WOP17217.1 hypothetical protein R0146_07915 [Raineyella sp. LH-20]
MSNSDNPIKASGSQPSRRTIVKGAAWAVPAIAVASATPAMAASPECLQFTLGPSACKWPGSGNNWSYNLELCVQNTCTGGGSVTITIEYLQTNSGASLVPCGTSPFPKQLVIPAGGSACTGSLGAFSSTNSASTIFIFGKVDGGTTTKIGEALAGPNLGECAGSTPCAA